MARNSVPRPLGPRLFKERVHPPFRESGAPKQRLSKLVWWRCLKRPARRSSSPDSSLFLRRAPLPLRDASRNRRSSAKASSVAIADYRCGARPVTRAGDPSGACRVDPVRQDFRGAARCSRTVPAAIRSLMSSGRDRIRQVFGAGITFWLSPEVGDKGGRDPSPLAE